MAPDNGASKDGVRRTSRECRPMLSNVAEVVVPAGGVVVVVSDLHLPPRATQASSRAVDALAARLGGGQVHTVVLAGDLLELLAFPETGPGQILDSHPQLVQALNAVSEGGGRVLYVLGNHDGGLAWDSEAVAEVATRLDVTLCLGVDVLFADSAGKPPRRVRVEHGHQLDPYNRFVDQSNPLDTPLGHHVVRQLLPQVETLGSSWLQDTRELVDATGFPSFLASRLAYRQMGQHLWWLLAPVGVILGLHLPGVIELLAGHAVTSAWTHRAQTLAAWGLVDLVLLAGVVWLLVRRTWRSISALGLGERGSGQNFAARQHGVQLVNAGWSGLITGHTHHAELQPMRGGFYANTGSATPIVQAARARLRLPPVYLRTQQICWVECVLTDTLTARLVIARYLLPGATYLERLVTTGRRPVGQPPTIVAHWPVNERRSPVPAPTGRPAVAARERAVATPTARTASAKSSPGERRPRRWRSPGRLTPTLLALLVSAFGLASLVSALIPAGREPLSDVALFLSEPASAAASAATAAAGLLLLYLAHGLRRRKKRAWRIALTGTALLLVLHAADKDIAQSAAAAVLLLVLLVGRRQFYALGDPSTRHQAVQVFATLLVVAVAAGLVLLQLYRDQVAGHPSLLAQLHQVTAGLVGIAGPLRFRTDRANDVVTFTLIAFGLLIAFITAYLALRPAAPRVALSREDEERLRALLARQGGRDSLGYFALRHDKTLAWSPSGKAAIAYRVIGGVALASGDPVGDPEAWPGALEAFLEQARTHAWVPAVLGCSEAGGTAWRRYGLDALELGDEAVLDVAEFRLQGRAMRNVRQAAGRISRAGYTARIRRLADIPDQEVEELRHAVANWRGAGTERGFSMALSRFGDRHDDECVVVSAHTAGRIMGVLNFVPWGPDGLSLDLMSRDRSADNGLNEFLITELIAAAPTIGVARISLNFAVFRSALDRGERLGAGPVTRLWSRLLIWASHWWQIDTLYHFNAKFQPQWYPRYVCFPAGRELPRIALAALEAEAFLSLPRPFRRSTR